MGMVYKKHLEIIYLAYIYLLKASPRGIICKTCKDEFGNPKRYHEECFLSDNIDTDENTEAHEKENENEESSIDVTINSQEDFDMGTMSGKNKKN